MNNIEQIITNASLEDKRNFLIDVGVTNIATTNEVEINCIIHGMLDNEEILEEQIIEELT